MDTREKIERVGAEIISLLISKNTDYGDSATSPINVFSEGNAVASLCARIDDKLSRIKQKGIYDKTEDTVKDLTGYLILLLIALKNEKQPDLWVETSFDTDDTYTVSGKDKTSLRNEKQPEIDEQNRNKPFRDHSGWFETRT